ncbi:MAG: iron-sulfur cluster assembly scaffold protein [Thermoplasmata archaeon]
MKKEDDVSRNLDVLSMYKEQILELYRHPNNFGKLKNYTNEHHEFNPVCGDEINIQLLIGDNKVNDIMFNGKGCAISIASASLITEHIKGKSINEIKKLNFHDVKKLLGVDIIYTRVKCATLALEAVKKALEKK